MKSMRGLVGLAVVLLGPGLWAQTATTKDVPLMTQTFFLKNVSESKEVNEVNTALRNLLDPEVKVYLVPSENAIVVRGDAGQIERARSLLEDLDRPRKSYRLIYTMTDVDGEKRVGVQHVSLVVVAGGRTTVKHGTKIPVATGQFHEGNAGTQTQMTYLDVGMNIDASLDESANGVRLRTKVERSSSTESVAIGGIDEPTVRQAVLEGTSLLTPGKAVMLGSLDVPATTRRLDIAVELELMK